MWEEEEEEEEEEYEAGEWEEEKEEDEEEEENEEEEGDVEEEEEEEEEEEVRCTKSYVHLSDRYCYLLPAAGSSNSLTNTWCCMCRFELLMMDGKKSEICRPSYRNK